MISEWEMQDWSWSQAKATFFSLHPTDLGKSGSLTQHWSPQVVLLTGIRKKYLKAYFLCFKFFAFKFLLIIKNYPII